MSNIEDGLNSFRIRLIVSANYPYTEDVDFIVNIYGEPLDRFPSNDFVLGEETANSRLVHTLVLIGHYILNAIYYNINIPLAKEEPLRWDLDISRGMVRFELSRSKLWTKMMA